MSIFTFLLFIDYRGFACFHNKKHRITKSRTLAVTNDCFNHRSINLLIIIFLINEAIVWHIKGPVLRIYCHLAVWLQTSTN